MTGLELARDYFRQEGPLMLERDFSQLLPRLVGLAGEGSHRFGFDDEFSKDHDWGPGFCIWMCDDDFAQYSTELQAARESSPRSFRGWESPPVGTDGAKRFGVHRTSVFFRSFLTGAPAAQ